jgi:hypothetical protein
LPPFAVHTKRLSYYKLIKKKAPFMTLYWTATVTPGYGYELSSGKLRNKNGPVDIGAGADRLKVMREVLSSNSRASQRASMFEILDSTYLGMINADPDAEEGDELGELFTRAGGNG